MNQKRNAFSYLILSIIGVILIIILIWFGGSNNNMINFYDKLMVGLAFISCCLVGLSMAFKPNRLRKIIHSGKQGPKQESKPINIDRQGHHPVCEKFINHTIKFNSKILCAGCTGLAIGSIISIVLMAIYILFFNDISQSILVIFIIIGMILIAINFIEVIISFKNTGVHIISNVFLVLGFSFVVIGMFQLTGAIIYGLFGIIISFLWLDTRIRLSNWRHNTLCTRCSEHCKAY